MYVYVYIYISYHICPRHAFTFAHTVWRKTNVLVLLHTYVKISLDVGLPASLKTEWLSLLAMHVQTLSIVLPPLYLKDLLDTPCFRKIPGSFCSWSQSIEIVDTVPTKKALDQGLARSVTRYFSQQNRCIAKTARGLVKIHDETTLQLLFSVRSLRVIPHDWEQNGWDTSLLTSTDTETIRNSLQTYRNPVHESLHTQALTRTSSTRVAFEREQIE